MPDIDVTIYNQATPISVIFEGTSIPGPTGPQGPEGPAGTGQGGGGTGSNGWSPVFSIVNDGIRRVERIVNWVGGGGTMPATGLYIGATGFVAPIANGVDVRGPSGASGDQGIQGLQGLTGPTGASGASGNQGIQGLTGPTGASGASGNAAWIPVFSIVNDGIRRVQQIINWFGGGGGMPNTGLYISATGFVAPIANAVDIRGSSGASGDQGVAGPSGASGNQGIQGIQGIQGVTGASGVSGASGDGGWSPVFSIVNDGIRRVQQVINWVGGTSVKPATGSYISATGFVGNIQSGVDIRGPSGASGDIGPQGPAGGGGSGTSGDAGWSPVFGVVADGIRYVQRVITWIGGTGPMPATGNYISATGFVGNIQSGVDIRGPSGLSGASGNQGIQGLQGTTGASGASGNAAWTPIFAIANDGIRRVQQVINWTGGGGSMPLTGTYVSFTGFVGNIQSGVDIRGPSGASGDQGIQGTQGIQGVTGVSGASGNSAWTPIFSIVNDGIRRVQQVITWTGGGGGMPATGLYISATGFVGNIQSGVDIRGPSGASGDQGIQGIQGLQGATGANGLSGNAAWTPIFAIASDGIRRVQQVVTWTGGGGPMPATGLYISATGFVGNIQSGVDIRGPSGASGDIGPQGIQGTTGASGLSGNAAWIPVFSIVNDGIRRVQQVFTWTGGGGPMPSTGLYISFTGFVGNIQSGVDIRGPSGASGDIGPAGATGPTGASGASGDAFPQYISITQAGHGFAAGNIIRLANTNPNVYVKALADTAVNAEVAGYVTLSGDVNTFRYISQGFVYTGVPIVAIGSVLFLDPTTSGALTTTEPSAINQVSKPLLLVTSSGFQGIFNNSRGVIITTATATTLAVNYYTGSRTLVLGDANRWVQIDATGANVLTVPATSGVAFPTGTQILYEQLGSGQTTFSPALGVTLRSRGAALKTNAQYSTASLVLTSGDSWNLAGDLA